MRCCLKGTYGNVNLESSAKMGTTRQVDLSVYGTDYLKGAKFGEVTVTATPNSGYQLDEIYVNGTAISGTSFTMPNEAVTVSATFSRNTSPSYSGSSLGSSRPTYENEVPEIEGGQLAVMLEQFVNLY